MSTASSKTQHSASSEAQPIDSDLELSTLPPSHSVHLESILITKLQNWHTEADTVEHLYLAENEIWRVFIFLVLLAEKNENCQNMRQLNTASSSATQ